MSNSTLSPSATAPDTVHSAPYAELRKLVKEAATLESIGSLLSWDQETYMPKSAGDFRAEQASLISAMAHQKATDPRVGELLEACESDANLMGAAHSAEAANIREIRRDYELARKLPTDLVSELARATSLAQDAWKTARAKSDFATFRPHLEHVLSLTRRKAECYGVPKFNGRTGELYDALLDEYEPGMSAAEITEIFTPLGKRLSGLVADLVNGSQKVSLEPVKAKLPEAQQQAFGLEVLRTMGFDLNAGRLDVTTHPFCSGMAPGDTRLTTRYTSESFLEPLYGTMHEGGHGLYEQGLPKGTRFGEPLGRSVSLGIHESQSRMWENLVGRSRAFWEWALPVAKKHFGPAVGGLTLNSVYAAANYVERSFIRVEADEATYNLHIMLRFELERGLISGALPVADLPGEWNRRFKASFGLDVPDDAHGCLQDVHWSFGLIGYFPTYTLGNLYAAQFWEAINRDIPALDAQIRSGDFSSLLGWLRNHIHQHGRRYSASELCKRATGAALSPEPLMRNLEGKLRPLYGA